MRFIFATDRSSGPRRCAFKNTIFSFRRKPLKPKNQQLDEQKYVFDVSIYVFLSWIDPRAPGNVAKATNETTVEGGRDCARLCIGQRAPSEESQCCDSLWLPSFVIRNADEMPQGRLQPYYITVDEATGVVTWRVQFRSNFYTSLDVQAFVSIWFWM